jgi:GNAT superfamily N-acetyltransferase
MPVAGSGYAEIGVVTHSDQRGKGYAKWILSYLIKQCIQAGITVEWSCNVDNQASLNTGLKMGFEINRYGMFLVPDCGNVLCQNLVDYLKNNSYP